MYLLAPDGRPAAREVITNELCVVGGEIYGSDIYLDGEPVMKFDAHGQISDYPSTRKYASYIELFLKFFKYGENDVQLAAKNFYTNWIREIDEEEYIAERTDIQAREPKMKSESYFQHPLYNLNPAQIRKQGKRIISPDYTNPRYIEIKDKKSMVMRYYNSGKDIELGKEDGGLLYVPEPGKVCLFATTGDVGIFDCDAHVEGLEQDCLDTKSEVDALVSAVSSCQK